MESENNLRFNKLNNYFKDVSIDTLNFMQKNTSESVLQYQYRSKLNNTLIEIYKFIPKSAAIISTLLRDQYFLGTKYRMDNELDDLIKDLIYTLKNKSKQNEVK